MVTKIDIVVPTLRLDLKRIVKIINLPVPSGMTVNYFIIVDRDIKESKEFIMRLADAKGVTIITNGRTLGGHESRNKGFEQGSAEYVLFLDDDVIPDSRLLKSYKRAIDENSAAIGFVGITKFPHPVNSSTNGVVASDILTFWDIAKTRPRVAWGVTANLLVKRDAVSHTRFLTFFPKGGGGEDVDFCLRIVERSVKWFVSVPDAFVVHPWWGSGSRQFRRFARWAFGDSRLPSLHPKFRFRNAPNLVESLILGSILLGGLSLIGFLPANVLPTWIVSVIVLEFLSEAVRLQHRQITFVTSIEATLVRLSNDLGRLLGNLSRGHITGFTERFDFFATQESIKYERKVAVVKFLLFLLPAALLPLLI